MAFLAGRLEEAEQAFQRNLQVGEEINDEFLRFVSWRWIGNIAYQQQDYAKAQQCFSKAQVIAHAIHILQAAGALPDLLDTLLRVSQWWLQAGASERAARLLGFVRQHPSLLPLGQQGAAQVYAQLQTMLPEEHLAADLAAGATMTVAEAVALALSECCQRSIRTWACELPVCATDGIIKS